MQIKKSLTMLFSLMLTLSLALTAGFGCAEKKTQLPGDGYENADVGNNNGMSLAYSGSPNVVYAADNETVAYVEQTLVATVSPSSMSDAPVSWSVAWASGAALASNKVADYLTVTPTNESGHNASVKAYKSFRGSNIIITCSALAAPDVKATITVKFNGIPASMTVDTTGLTANNRGTVTAYEIPVGTTATKDITLSNIFGDVGSDYSNYSVSVTGVGSYVTGKYCNDRYGTYWEESSLKDVTLESTKATFISATITNGKVAIQAKDCYKSIKGGMTGNTGGVYYTGRYKEEKTTNGNLPYYQITVTEKTSGVKYTFNVITVPGISGVSSSKTELVF